MVKTLFVQNVWTGYYTQYLAVMQLSSILLKYGHECELAIGNNKEIISKIKEYQPDIITLSSMDSGKEWIEKTTKLIKKISKALIIVGGPIAFSEPEIVNSKFIDALVVGEGEDAILEIANRVQNKKDFSDVTNVITYKNGSIIKSKELSYVQDLDKLPFPDRDIYKKNNPYKRNLIQEFFMISRGCPYKCSYCFYSTMKDNYQYPQQTRKRSIKNIIEEIKNYAEKENIKSIYFADSLLTSDKKWLIKFLKKYREEINLEFSGNGHYNHLDEEIIQELKKSGCSCINAGGETGDEHLRKFVLNKHVTNDRIKKVAKLLHKHKLKFASLNMMGLPGETFEQAMKTIKLNQDIKPTYTTMPIFLSYPDLNATKYALKNKYLKKEKLYLLSKEKHRMMRSILTQKDIRKVSNLQKFATILVYNPVLKPIVMLLIKLPENKIFDYIYYTYANYHFRKMHKTSNYKLIWSIARVTLYHLNKPLKTIYNKLTSS